MTYVYGWVKNIVYYFIFMTVVHNVLPSRKYEKYIKLFSGLILVVIVIQPLATGLNLEDRMAYYFESITFQNEVNDFEKELLGIEHQRVQQMIGQYEQAVAMDLDKMTIDAGLFPRKTTVVIGKEQGTNEFGAVLEIDMIVSAVEGASALDAVSPIEQIQIQIQSEAAVPAETANRQEEYKEEQTALNGLKRKVESYYGLESAKVKIQFENE